MTITPTPLVAALLAGLNTASARVDAVGVLVEHDRQFALWVTGAEHSLVGQPLVDVVPEFFGQEDMLEDTRRGRRAEWKLHHVYRQTPQGDTFYVTFTAVRLPGEPEAELALFVTDTTEQSAYIQQLTQSRNEAQLLQRKLTQANAQLDLLLRHYLSPEVAAALVTGELRPELGGELREVTILFADVRGFTSLAERLPPTQVMQLLNTYLGIVVAAIESQDGTINQFVGDNAMAIFNMQCTQPDHAARAVRAGMAVQRALHAHHRDCPPDSPQLHFGVGIHTGKAIIGNSGARWRYTFTAIGDTTNLAARITGAAPADELWISGDTRAQLPDQVAVIPLPVQTFKGRHTPTALFHVPVSQELP